MKYLPIKHIVRPMELLKKLPSKKFLNSVLILGMISIAYSQQPELPNLTLPSPTAYELGKVGQIPVGMFTGTPQVDIPLYTYRTKNLSVPISLSYANNGIKVDQLSTNVGLGWNLNIGGVITRIVKDESDEKYRYFYPEEEIHQVGINSPMALDFFFQGSLAGADTETDIFMFNFNGYSGKFLFDNNGGIVTVPHKSLLISNHSENGKNGFKIITPDGVTYLFLEEEITGNRVASGNHTTPEFETTAWYLTKIIHPKGDFIEFTYSQQGYSYDMSKVQSMTVLTPPSQYDCNNNLASSPNPEGPVLTNRFQTTGKTLTQVNSDSAIDGYVSINSITAHPDITSHKLVTDIQVKDDSNTVIEKFDFVYLSTTNNRIFLDNITYKDPNKKYSFEYIDPQGFPSRLSTAQDYWGYYNGKTNNTHYFPNPQDLLFVPQELSVQNIGADKSSDHEFAEKGLLSKVIYPTKGYKELVYEPNSYWGDKTIYPLKENLYLHLNTASGNIGNQYDDVETTSIIPFDHEVSFNVFTSFNSSEYSPGNGCDEDLGKTAVRVEVKDVQTGSLINIYRKTNNGNISEGTAVTIKPNSPYNEFYLSFEESHSYEVSIHPIRECTSANLQLSYYDEPSITQMVNNPTGGLRIREIVTNSVSSTTSPDKKRFYYGKKESKTESSGEPGKTAYYLSKQTNRINCGQCFNADITYTSINSSSVRPLFNSSSNGTTYYKYVTVSHGGDNFENGGEENEFIIHNDYPGNPIKGDPIESSTWVNAGWSNGLLRKKSVFKMDQSNDFLTLKQRINNYVEDNRYSEKVYGYSINKKYDNPCSSAITYQCSQSDLSRTWTKWSCVADHGHKWGARLFTGHWVCYAPGWDMQPIISKSVCHIDNGGYAGKTITNPHNLDNLDIMEYTTNSYWFYLNQSIDLQYDENGQNPIENITDYYYDNLSHLQLTRTKTTSSDGESIITSTQYPDDVLTTTTLGMAPLSQTEFDAVEKLKTPSTSDPDAQYRISEPVQSLVYKDMNSNGIAESNELISAQRTGYLDWNSNSSEFDIFPQSIKTLKGQYSGTNNMQERIVFNAYDSKGNPTEVSKVDGAPISYVYGYDQSYPVAKIENATRAQIEALSGFGTDFHAGSGGLTIAQENTLRGLTKAMVTTYTYRPLIGVTSITDSKGYTTYYEYDPYNRLQYVRDADNNLISENKYNYKN